MFFQNYFFVLNCGSQETIEMFSSSKFAAKSKHLHDEEKNEEMNKFVNGYIASLSEAEKKLPFLMNHARALKAYAEHKRNVSVTWSYKLQQQSFVTPRYVVV